MTSVGDDAGNIYVDIPASRSIDTAAGDGLELWYAKDSLAGATKVTPVGPTINVVVVWEVAGIRTDAPFDTASEIGDQAATATPLGAALTTGVADEIVIAATIVRNGVSSIHAGNAFTNDLRTNGNGWAHLSSANAPAGDYQAEWDQGMAGTYCSSSASLRPVLSEPLRDRTR